MKKILLLLLLFPAFSFSQSLTGKWVSAQDQREFIEFKTNGTMGSVQFENPGPPSEMTIKYSQIEEIEITYLLCDIYFKEKVLDHTKSKFILDGDKLTIYEKVTVYNNITKQVESGRIREVVYFRKKNEF